MQIHDINQMVHNGDTCDECVEFRDELIEIGDGNGKRDDGYPMLLCEGCLKKALRLIDNKLEESEKIKYTSVGFETNISYKPKTASVQSDPESMKNVKCH